MTDQLLENIHLGKQKQKNSEVYYMQILHIHSLLMTIKF